MTISPIQDSIPIPEPKSYNRALYPFRELNKNQSFEVRADNVNEYTSVWNSIRSLACRHTSKHRKFTCRSFREYLVVRVWRVA